MKEFMNYETMFAQSIGLKEPWKIEKAEFDERERAVHVYVYVSASKTAKYECPVCGKMCDRYDDEEKEKSMATRRCSVLSLLCALQTTESKVR